MKSCLREGNISMLFYHPVVDVVALKSWLCVRYYYYRTITCTYPVLTPIYAVMRLEVCAIWRIWILNGIDMEYYHCRLDVSSPTTNLQCPHNPHHLNVVVPKEIRTYSLWYYPYVHFNPSLVLPLRALQSLFGITPKYTSIPCS